MLKKLNNKIAGVEWDQLAKIILALVALIILIYIITQVIGVELGNQSDIVTGGFKKFGN